MPTGTFSVSRELLAHSLWTGEKFTRGQAWVDLVGHARWKAGFIRVRGQRIDLDRGELAWSERELAKRWKWSRGKVDRFLDELQDDERIIRYQQKIKSPSGEEKPLISIPATEPQTRPVKNYLTSIIRVLNYDMYQPNGASDEATDDTSDGPATDQQRAQKNKEKKDKKGKEGSLADFDEMCLEARFELLRPPAIRNKVEFWLGCRKDLKKPLVKNAVKLDMLNMVRVLKAGGTAELIGEWMVKAQYNRWQGWYFLDEFKKWKAAKAATSAGRETFVPYSERGDDYEW